MYATPKRAFSSVTHALFQASMWRCYAMAFLHMNKPGQKYQRYWVEEVLQLTKAECVERAREALEAAKEMNNRTTKEPHE